MARITFQKRQKEMKRQEKQRMKAEKRAQRKVEKSMQAAGSADILEVAPDHQLNPSESVTDSDSVVE